MMTMMAMMRRVLSKESDGRRYKLPDEVSCKSKEDDGVCSVG
jgi:hypothetical protein